MRKFIALLLLAVVLGAALPTLAQEDTIATILTNSASGETPEFTSLLAVAQAADPSVIAALSDPEADLTLFAPTDAAFELTLTGLGLTLEQVTSDQALSTQMVLYHIVGARFDSAVLTTLAQNNDTLISMEGTPLSLSLVSGALVVNSSNIVTPDVLASNGVIHVIDSVLLTSDAPPTTPEPTDETPTVEPTSETPTIEPTDGTETLEPTLETPTVEPTTEPTNTIADVLTTSAAGTPPQFGVLLAAVQAADPSILTALSDPNVSITLFAPTDEAFAQLLVDLNMTPNDLFADTALLTQVLSYHIVNGLHDTTELTDLASQGGTLGTIEGSALTFSLAEGGILQVNDASVTIGNVAASNGVIHVIDRVLLPATVLPPTSEPTLETPTLEPTVETPTIEPTPTLEPTLETPTLVPTPTLEGTPSEPPTIPAPVEVPVIDALQNADSLLIVAFTDANGDSTLIATTTGSLNSIIAALQSGAVGVGAESMDLMVCEISVAPGTSNDTSPEVDEDLAEIQALAQALLSTPVDIALNCEVLVQG